MDPSQLSDPLRATSTGFLGSWWSLGPGTALKFSFMDVLPTYITPTSVRSIQGSLYTGNWHADARAPGSFQAIVQQDAYVADAVREAISWYTDVLGVTIQGSQGSVGDIAIGSINLNASLGGGSVAAIAHYPNDTDSQARGDIFINRGSSSTQTLASLTSVFAHEFGHALGLVHDDVGRIPGAQGQEATALYSIINTNLPPSFPPYPISNVQSLMLYDIAALQARYGKSDKRDGPGDIYTYRPEMAAMQANFVTPKDITDGLSTIWDAGGARDVINASALTANGIIDLRQGQFSVISNSRPDLWNVAIAFGAEIENVVGGRVADLIIGNSLGNSLLGGAGDDRIFSDGWVYGLHKRDTDRPPADSVAPAQVGADTIDGGIGRDFIRATEGSSVVGGAGDDILIMPRGARRAEGGSDRDVIFSLAQIEEIVLGEGNDVVLLSGEALKNTKVIAKLDELMPDWQEVLGAEVDEFFREGGGLNTEFAALDGGAGDDVIFGGDGANFLSDQEGADYLIGGAGADYLVGREGDTLDGGEGNDIYDGDGGLILFGRGSGHDVRLDQRISIYFPDVTSSEVSLNWQYQDYDLTVEGDRDYVMSTLDWENPPSYGIVRIGDAEIQIDATGDSIHVGLLSQFYQTETERENASISVHGIASFSDDPTSSPVSGPGLVGFPPSQALAAHFAGRPDGVSPAPGVLPTATGVAYSGTGAPDQFTAGSGADIAAGNAGEDLLDGATGNDTMDGGAGADTLIGGSGLDWANYANASGGVLVNLSLAGAQADGPEGADSLVSIENLAGSILADTLLGAADANALAGGAGDDSLGGQGGDDVLMGGSGADTLDGGTGAADLADYGGSTAAVAVNLLTNASTGGDAGGDSLVGVEGVRGSGFADTLTAGAAAATLDGAEGNDSVFGGNASDSIFGAAGLDTLLGLSGNDTIDGGDGNDTIDGGNNSDLLLGGAGDDTLRGVGGIDSFVGGGGEDWADYVFYAIGVTASLAEAGAQTINGATDIDVFTDIEHLRGGGATDRLSGSIGDNSLAGGNGNDTLIGAEGNDVLDGGSGDDLLQGGIGDDVYILNATTDTIEELADAGQDTVRAVLTGGSYTLGNHLDVLQMQGTLITGIGNALSNLIVGNASANSLSGGDGNDTLDGGAGVDTLAGGAGDDFFIVDLATDATTEVPGAGIDTIQSAVSRTLTADVEVLILTGTAARVGNGNAAANLIIGTVANDTMNGLQGDDTLEGGAGNDTLLGNLGNDFASYASASAGVTVDLRVAGGQATGSTGTDTLTQIENLQGSAWADTLIGNTAANTLVGGDGADSLLGEQGNDRLLGGIGNDTLVGGIGADVLDGGDGLDWASFAGSTSGVTVSIGTTAGNGGEAAGDTILGVEALVGSASADTLGGGNGGDTLDGGAGADSLSAGTGNDHYIVDVATDTVVEATDAGSDTLQASFNATLGANLEALILTGSTGLTGTGNSAANLLIGNGGNNSLAGGDGDDTLMGGDGADTLVGAAGNDWTSYASATAGVLIDVQLTGPQPAGAAGTDSIVGIENLIGSEFGDTLLGTATANALVGAGGNDSLVARAGDDTLFGDVGDDTLAGGTGADAIDGGSGNDWALYETASASVAVSLATGSGSAGDATADTLAGIEALVGSAFADTLTGGDDQETIRGGAGADRLDGGGGEDWLDHATATAAVTINLTTGVASGGDAQGDTFDAFEHVSGGAANDALTGSASANILVGGAGNDFLTGAAGADSLFGDAGIDQLNGGAGADFLDGGADIDWAVYNTASAGVHADLLRGAGLAGDALGDVLRNIERLVGSFHADTLVGNFGDNALRGNAGGDLLDGSAGIDGLDYSTSAGGVTVNLATSAVSGGDAQGDTIANFENVSGGASADALTGNSKANVLDGLGGNDTLMGGDGADTITGGVGVDRLGGGADADRFRWFAATESGLAASADVVTDFVTAEGDRMDLSFIDPNSVLAGNQAFSFLGTGAFVSGTRGQLRYENRADGNTWVQADLDGNQAADFEIVLLGSRALTAADFVL